MKLEINQHSNTLGADLRALRKARKITLQALADTLGRSVGWISQVERDISQPNIDELRALAAALTVPISLFFGQSAAKADEVGRVVRSGTRREIGNGEQGLKEELLSPDLTDDFEVLRSVFQPNAELTHFVTRPTQEVGYLVSGKLKLWIGEQVFELDEGDSFRIRGEKFKWANPYGRDAVVVWVIAPPVY